MSSNRSNKKNVQIRYKMQSADIVKIVQLATRYFQEDIAKESQNAINIKFDQQVIMKADGNENERFFYRLNSNINFPITKQSFRSSIETFIRDEFVNYLNNTDNREKLVEFLCDFIKEPEFTIESYYTDDICTLDKGNFIFHTAKYKKLTEIAKNIAEKIQHNLNLLCENLNVEKDIVKTITGDAFLIKVNEKCVNEGTRISWSNFYQFFRIILFSAVRDQLYNILKNKTLLFVKDCMEKNYNDINRGINEAYNYYINRVDTIKNSS